MGQNRTTGRVDFQWVLVINGLRRDKIGQSGFLPEMEASISEYEYAAGVNCPQLRQGLHLSRHGFGITHCYTDVKRDMVILSARRFVAGAETGRAPEACRTNGSYTNGQRHVPYGTWHCRALQTPGSRRDSCSNGTCVFSGFAGSA